MKCSVCRLEMRIRAVTRHDGARIEQHSCCNPQCPQRGKPVTVSRPDGQSDGRQAAAPRT